MELSKRQKQILQILSVNRQDYKSNEGFVLAVEAGFLNYQNKIKQPKSYAFPSIQVANNTSIVEHEASVGRVSDTQISYLRSRGLDQNQSLSLIITKNFSQILNNLPLEFAIEAKKLIESSLLK